jgi:predicted Zn-dependent protease with MMP-like domain
MISISREEFVVLLNKVIAQLPPDYLARIKNVAFIVEDQPSNEQRQKLMLRPTQTLFGLYEGVPLSQRLGMEKVLPDKITIFQKPLEYASTNEHELFVNIGKTVWHEVAHYFGLNHDQIRELENKNASKKPKL